MGKEPGLAFTLPLRLARIARENGADILHCHNFGALYYGALAGFLARTPSVIYTAHGPKFPGGTRRAWFQRLPLTDRIVAVSEFVRESAIESAGINPKKVVTIYNGIETERFLTPRKRPAEEIKRGIGIEKAGAVIGTVARLSPEKDHFTLLEAFGRLTKGSDNAFLVVVGDGEMLAALERRAGELGVRESVVFLGNRRDIPELLSVFDVFALSSKEEGLGITLLEAMGSGIPVIATRVGGIPEIVENGVTGLLVSPESPEQLADGITWLLEHREETRAIVKAGFQQIRTRFSVENMIRKYEGLYRDALSLRATN
jgi:glycosyltransferase involved in cell wall biosynthesis